MMIGTASMTMISGWARICSPWKENNSTSVVKSAISDTGLSRFRVAEGCLAIYKQCLAPHLDDDHRDNDEQDDREKQGLPRHRDRRETEKESDDRREGKDHDGVVERDLRKREVRLSVAEVRPHKNHRRAGSSGKDNQAGDVAVDLFDGQVRAEQPPDEQPAEQCHRERLDTPVDE